MLIHTFEFLNTLFSELRNQNGTLEVKKTVEYNIIIIMCK